MRKPKGAAMFLREFNGVPVHGVCKWQESSLGCLVLMKGQHRDLVTYSTCLRHFAKDVTLRGLCFLLISIAHNLNLHVYFSLLNV